MNTTTIQVTASGKRVRVYPYGVFWMCVGEGEGKGVSVGSDGEIRGYDERVHSVSCGERVSRRGVKLFMGLYSEGVLVV